MHYIATNYVLQIPNSHDYCLVHAVYRLDLTLAQHSTIKWTEICAHQFEWNWEVLFHMEICQCMKRNPLNNMRTHLSYLIWMYASIHASSEWIFLFTGISIFFFSERKIKIVIFSFIGRLWGEKQPRKLSLFWGRKYHDNFPIVIIIITLTKLNSLLLKEKRLIKCTSVY